MTLWDLLASSLGPLQILHMTLNTIQSAVGEHIRATSHMIVDARDHYTSSTLIGG